MDGVVINIVQYLICVLWISMFQTPGYLFSCVFPIVHLEVYYYPFLVFFIIVFCIPLFQESPWYAKFYDRDFKKLYVSMMTRFMTYVLRFVITFSPCKSANRRIIFWLHICLVLHILWCCMHKTFDPNNKPKYRAGYRAWLGSLRLGSV
jgi:hypothetical protein